MAYVPHTYRWNFCVFTGSSDKQERVQQNKVFTFLGLEVVYHPVRDKLPYLYRDDSRLLVHDPLGFVPRPLKLEEKAKPNDGPYSSPFLLFHRLVPELSALC